MDRQPWRVVAGVVLVLALLVLRTKLVDEGIIYGATRLRALNLATGGAILAVYLLVRWWGRSQEKGGEQLRSTRGRCGVDRWSHCSARGVRPAGT